MHTRAEEVRLFLQRFLSGTERVASEQGLEKANKNLKLLVSRYGVEEEGRYYVNSFLELKKDGAYELIKMSSKKPLQPKA